MFMLKDQVDLLSVFNSHGVESLVIGGHAVKAYTQGRFTKDPDLFIRASESNAVAVFKALAESGAPLANMTPASFASNAGEYFQIAVEPDQSDVLKKIEGVFFEDAWQHSRLGSVQGLPVRFISREHLTANKLASGRPRDLGDVDELRTFAQKA